MPLSLRDLVNFSEARDGSAAVQMEDGLSQRAEALVDRYTPTHSSRRILAHLDRAVLSASEATTRAMIWHGRYGSGKSHLAVLVGHLLRHGAHTPAWEGFRQRLANMGEGRLAELLSYTFIADTDKDHRPYLLVPLYASAGPTLPAALVSGLYRGLRLAGFDPDALLPRTEFTVTEERFDQMMQHSPELAGACLDQWGLSSHYLTTQELRQGLAERRPEALETFREWYPKINHGTLFDFKTVGGLGTIECYQEAAERLSDQHGYMGIAVLWDEFGHALEELFTTATRSPAKELMLLQRFVETTCAPGIGHVLFIGLTHYDLPEYAQRSRLDSSLTDRLHTVSGRFSRDLRVELRPAEVEGYDLIGAQTGLTPEGRALLATPAAQTRCAALAEACAPLPVFATMRSDLPRITQLVYPFHPVTVAGLLAVAAFGQFAQANRTVFTFLRSLLDEQPDLETRPLDPDALFGAELIRLPTLFTVYREALRVDSPRVLQEHDRAVAQVTAASLEPAARARYLDLLAVITLGPVLGKDLQPTRTLLAAALYDAEDCPVGPWIDDLEWLRAAGLAYESRHTGIWQLHSDQGVDLEEIIRKADEALGERPTVRDLLRREGVCQDLLPHVGRQDLDPSPAGIVRTFSVTLPDWPIDWGRLCIERRVSAQVFLTLPPDAAAAAQVVAECQQVADPQDRPIYLWVPMVGVAGLLPPLRRYLAIDGLLARPESFGEGLLLRLQDEWEGARAQVLQGLAERFGRLGLEQGIPAVRVLCSSDWSRPLNQEGTPLLSWHAFVRHLAHQVNACYPKELRVRAMNVNQLCPDDTRTLPKLTDLLHSILHFSEISPADRTDLLGLTPTTENAAVIDGVFGANGLFEQRAEGWHLKTPKEADGPAGEVLQLIERHVTARRERPASMKELRQILFDPPYGIPGQALPLLAAAALRAYRPRLAWERAGKRSFEDMLADAFLDTDDDTRLCWEDLNRQERGVLALLRRAMDRFNLPVVEGDEETDSLRRLQSYVRDLPTEALGSCGLTVQDRALVERQMNATPHQFASALVTWLGTQSELTGCTGDPDQCPESWRRIERLVHNLASARDQRAAQVRDALRGTLEELLGGLESDARQALVAHLAQQQDALAQTVAPLARIPLITDGQLDTLLQMASGKAAGDCGDLDVGELRGHLKILLIPPESLAVRRKRALDPVRDQLARWAGWDAARRETLDEVLQLIGPEPLRQALAVLRNPNIIADPQGDAGDEVALIALYEAALPGQEATFEEQERIRVLTQMQQWQTRADHYKLPRQRRNDAMANLERYLSREFPTSTDMDALCRTLESQDHLALAQVLRHPPRWHENPTPLLLLYEAALGDGPRPEYAPEEIGRIKGTLGAWFQQAQQTIEIKKSFPSELYRVIMSHYARGLDKETLLVELREMVRRFEDI